MTNVVQRGWAILSTRGVRGLVAAVSARLRHGDRGADYQEKVFYGLDERSQQVERALTPDCRNLLDVGCNLGDMTAHCARRGLWAIGVDRSADVIERARRRHAGTPACGFVVLDMSPENVGSLPAFDATLLLSVHHHWLRAYGPDRTRDMLRALAERTKRVLIFQAPSRRVRYGEHAPDFMDNDEESVTSFITAYLSTTIADQFSRIEPLGRVPCVGDREPYRWSFGLYK